MLAEKGKVISVNEGGWLFSVLNPQESSSLPQRKNALHHQFLHKQPFGLIFCFFIFDKNTSLRNVLVSSSLHHKRTRAESSVMPMTFSSRVQQYQREGWGLWQTEDTLWLKGVVVTEIFNFHHAGMQTSLGRSPNGPREARNLGFYMESPNFEMLATHTN